MITWKVYVTWLVVYQDIILPQNQRKNAKLFLIYIALTVGLYKGWRHAELILNILTKYFFFKS